MNRRDRNRIRTRALLAALAFAGGMLLASHTAQAQGPYGRNSYADWPFNQGSLFYRPLKPKPKPRARVVRPALPAARAAGAVQPYYYYQNGRYYYYYPAAPAAPTAGR
jgi:hypothetical protein